MQRRLLGRNPLCQLEDLARCYLGAGRIDDGGRRTRDSLQICNAKLYGLALAVGARRGKLAAHANPGDAPDVKPYATAVVGLQSCCADLSRVRRLASKQRLRTPRGGGVEIRFLVRNGAAFENSLHALVDKRGRRIGGQSLKRLNKCRRKGPVRFG